MSAKSTLNPTSPPELHRAQVAVILNTVKDLCICPFALFRLPFSQLTTHLNANPLAHDRFPLLAIPYPLAARPCRRRHGILPWPASTPGLTPNRRLGLPESLRSQFGSGLQLLIVRGSKNGPACRPLCLGNLFPVNLPLHVGAAYDGKYFG